MEGEQAWRGLEDVERMSMNFQNISISHSLFTYGEEGKVTQFYGGGYKKCLQGYKEKERDHSIIF